MRSSQHRPLAALRHNDTRLRPQFRFICVHVCVFCVPCVYFIILYVVLLSHDGVDLVGLKHNPLGTYLPSVL